METRKEHTYQPIASEREYYDLEHRSEIREGARKLRRQYLRYKEAEIIYSMSHKKLLELAGKAGAIFRMDGTVLIKRDIFDRYLEQFREESTEVSDMSGCIWKFSDQIDDVDVEMLRRDFITFREAMEYYGLNEKPVVRLAREAGSVYKIGKMVRIRRSIFEEYLRQTQYIGRQEKSCEKN